MKKILLYTDTPQVGGAELQMFLLAKFLNKEEFQPILACSNFENLNKWCENFEKEGIKVIRMRVKGKHDIKHYSLLKKILKNEQIDILHAHVWNPASCRFAFLAAKARKTKIIVTEHDPFRLPFLKDIFKKYTLKLVSRVIAVSEENKKTLQKLYPKFSKKIETIHNGLDLVWWESQLLRFTDLDYKKIKKEIFLAHEHSLIIISIAELHERKGLKYLISAFAKAAKKFPNTKLVILGEGTERKNLEHQIEKEKMEKHIALLGHRKEIPKLLKSADIFVLPSRREAFGYVNLEAMTIPLPIIATRTGGIPEVIQNGKNGLLVEPENIEEMGNALINLIGDEKLRKKMADEGKKILEKKFSAKIMAEKYEKIYFSTISA